jgi:hypothetical protein
LVGSRLIPSRSDDGFGRLGLDEIVAYTDALGKHGFDIRGGLSAPIRRVPRRAAKNGGLMGDPGLLATP